MSTACQVTISRGDIPAFLMEAHALAEAGLSDQALAHLTDAALGQILEMDLSDPRTASCLILLGRTWRCLGRLKEAVEAYERVLLCGAGGAVRVELAGLYRDMGRFSDALGCCQEALKGSGDDPEIQGLYASCLIRTGDLDAGLEVMRGLVHSGRAEPQGHSQYLWHLLYLPDIAPERLLEEHRLWACRHTPVHLARTCHLNTPDSMRRIRIGYLSADFRRHSVAYTFEAILEGRDRDNVEVFGYGSVANPDDVTHRLARGFDRYRDVVRLGDEAVADAIQADRIDVLVGIAGHTSGHRMRVLGYKPAPIQVDFQSVVTTGIEQVDYRFTDDLLDPPGSEHLYVEKSVAVAGGLVCYRPPAYAPPIGPPPMIRNGFVTFGSFANALKIHDGVVAVWARILGQVPGSRCVIKCPGGQDGAIRSKLIGRFESCGIDRGRVRIHGWLPVPEHWALYNEVDIALDTFPFNGCVTTLEGLWMGVPMVSLAGPRYTSRMGLTLLSRVGLERLVGRDPDEMAAKAVALAGHPDVLARLRGHLRARMLASPLCDIRRMARELEAAYRRMWRQWCDRQIKNQKSKIKIGGSTIHSCGGGRIA